MHIDFNISVGNIVTIIAVLGAIWRIERLSGKYLIEHEILIHDFCVRNNMKIGDLPTRSKQ
jgi:hypothetical protein